MAAGSQRLERRLVVDTRSPFRTRLTHQPWGRPPGSPPPPSPLSRPPYGTWSKSVSFLTLGGGLAPAVGGELRERGPRQVRPPRRPRDLARCPAHWPARRAAFGRWMRDARVQVAAAGFSARM